MTDSAVEKFWESFVCFLCRRTRSDDAQAKAAIGSLRYDWLYCVQPAKRFQP
jgi:hypothetical protein